MASDTSQTWVDPRTQLDKQQLWYSEYARDLHPRHFLCTELHYATARIARRVLLGLRKDIGSTDVSVSKAAIATYRHALATRVRCLAQTLAAALTLISPQDRTVASLRSRLGSALQMAAANEVAGTAEVVAKMIEQEADSDGTALVWLSTKEGRLLPTGGTGQSGIEAKDVESAQRIKNRVAISCCRQEAVAQEKQAIDTMERFYGYTQVDLLFHGQLAYLEEEGEDS